MSLPTDLNGFINPILSVFVNDLQYRLNGYLVTAYLRGSAQMVQWGRTKTTDMPIYYEGPPMQDAINYASKHTATLVKGLNDETRDLMRNTIEKAIKEKRGIPGLARDLRTQFDNMTKVRSQVIARTETADALEQSFMDRAKDIGVTGKEWIVTDPCPICEANGNEGPVPLDHVFSSGDMRPPAHPNCRCALAPVMLKEK
jgi:SPP1 gp7 family putative phage head morphogenesis protein